MHHVSNDERRARLAVRHHLAATARTNDLVRVAGDLVGLHSSDPAAVFLSAAVRAKTPKQTVASLERALYDTTGEVVVKILEDSGRETAAAVEDAAAGLEQWFGKTRFTPRFPAPLQKLLVR